MSSSVRDHGPRVLAAVDLGSNSFHMVIARYEDGHLILLDRLREMVRLAEGLDEKLNLSPDVQQRALECLARFGERINTFHPNDVAVAGTNTLRRARDSEMFIARAEAALGHPIEIISGLEEARLVYLGVAHAIPPTKKRRLVLDIGGGSTEFIIGRRFKPERLYSLFMGCVGISKTFFPEGKISRDAWQAARLAVEFEMNPIKGPLRDIGWREVYGSSGTIRTIGRLLQQRDDAQLGIRRKALKELVNEVRSLNHIDEFVDLDLSDKRRPVFAGGLVVLERVFKTLSIDTLYVADYALREGLLYDTIGHWSGEDARERSVKLLARMYDADKIQSRRLDDVSHTLLSQVRDAWQLPRGKSRRLLHWSSRLHEIGLGIAHSHYHRHGAYVIRNADLPGFSREGQQRLAWLVEGHRGRVPALPPLPELSPWRERLPRLLAIFRVATAMVRGRNAGELPRLTASANAANLHLELPNGWLERHPLTQAALREESTRLPALGVRFTFR
ncbi:MAG: Ppx/GppA phosphatase family protein [Pseudomonadota bacterium]